MSSPSTKIIPFSGYNNIGVDFINEETAGQGVAVDQSSGGRGTLLKDGGVGLENGAWLYARNQANSAEVNLIRLNSSNVGELDTTAFAARSNSAAVVAGCTCSGAMTISSVVVTTARYLFLGPLVFYELNVAFTLGGTPSTTVKIPLPVASSGNAWNVLAIANPTIGTYRLGLGYANGSNLEIIQGDQAANWAVGAGQTVQGHAWYWR